MWEMSILWTDFFHLFYYFMIYSFMGWCMETCLVSFRSKEFVNRGFMNGPFCPIYGCGASAVYLFLTPLKENHLAVFLGGIILASTIEFLTSYVMEKLFHARWWDYSDKKYNLQGRICLSISICWGILSWIMLNVFQPVILRLVGFIPETIGEILGTLILIYFAVDITITVKHVLKFSERLKELSRLREDFNQRLEASMLYSTAEEARERLEGLSYSEVLEEVSEKIAQKLEAGKENIALMREKMDRLSLDLKRIRDEVKRNLGRSSVEARLLRAFPGIKLTRGNQKSFEEFKRYLISRRHNSKED